MKEISDSLLKGVKSALQITWDTEDDQLRDSILQGEAYLIARIGQVDFESTDLSGSLARRLLREYMRYDWNDFGSSFESDYLKDILNAQLTIAMERHKNYE